MQIFSKMEHSERHETTDARLTGRYLKFYHTKACLAKLQSFRVFRDSRPNQAGFLFFNFGEIAK
jgi:hypothetical protein